MSARAQNEPQLPRPDGRRRISDWSRFEALHSAARRLREIPPGLPRAQAEGVPHVAPLVCEDIRARIREIDEKANVLLENMSPDTKGFVDAKLRDMGTERRKLLARSESLETAPYDPIDADAVLRNGLASLHDLPRLMGSASMEDQKEFVRAFVAGVSVVPGDARLDVQMRTLPAVGSLLPANSTCGLVAGARYEQVQMNLQPLNRYLAGLRWAA